MPSTAHYVAGAIAFSLTKKIIVISTVHLYGVGRLVRYELSLLRRREREREGEREGECGSGGTSPGPRR